MYKFALTILLLILPISVSSELRIDITKGNTEPIPVALVKFSSKSGEEVKVSNDINKVISNNLQRSGLFKILPESVFLKNVLDFDQKPSFPDWKITTAQGLVHGKLTVSRDKLNINFRLWDVFSEKQMVAQQLSTELANWRRIAHVISDIIYKRITGESGYFDSRIVYISESGPKNKRIKRLAIVDQDGANHKFLTDGSYLALTPRFSPAAQEVAYLSYNNKIPRIFLLDLNTGVQKILGDFPGMTFSPRYSPDGKKLVMSLARNGNTDIVNQKIIKTELIIINCFEYLLTLDSIYLSVLNSFQVLIKTGVRRIPTPKIVSIEVAPADPNNINVSFLRSL